MYHPEFEQQLSCMTCDAQITGTPIFDSGLWFCCPGCLAGGECMCFLAERRERRVRHCLDIADPELPSRMAGSPRAVALSGR